MKEKILHKLQDENWLKKPAFLRENLPSRENFHQTQQ